MCTSAHEAGWGDREHVGFWELACAKARLAGRHLSAAELGLTPERMCKA